VDEFPVLRTFFSRDQLHQRFRERFLVLEWWASYPQLFDEDDLRIAINQAPLGYHYFEWLCAILLYHTTGWLSLVGKYAFESHRRKRAILQSLAEPTVIDSLSLRGNESRVQCPDLLVYRPDLTDWFLCEVKGPRDYLRDTQVAAFRDIRQRTDKKIYLIEVVETDRGDQIAEFPSPEEIHQ